MAPAPLPGGIAGPELSRSQKCTQVYLPTVTLGVALLLICLGYSWLLAIMPQVYTDLACLKLFNESFQACKNQSTTELKARWSNATLGANNDGAFIGLCMAVTQACMCPILCTFADTVGRKWVLVGMGLMTSLFFIGVAVIPHAFLLQAAPYLGAVSGLSGGIYAYLAVTFAAVADLTAPLSPKERTVLFGMVESMCWIGLAAGPLLASLVVGKLAPNKEIVGMQQTFFVSVGCLGAAVALLVIFMRESLRKRGKLTWASINPIAGLMSVKSCSVAFIVVSNAVMLVATAAGNAILPLYLLNYFASPTEFADQSYVMSIYFASLGTGLLIVLPLVSKCASQRALLLLSAALTIVTWSLFGAPRTMWVFFVVAGACGANGFMFPVVRTFLTRHFGHEHYGNALGILALLQSLSAIVSPVIRVPLWDVELSAGVQGLSFFICGGVGVIGLVFAALVRFPRDEKVAGAKTPRASAHDVDGGGDGEDDGDGNGAGTGTGGGNDFGDAEAPLANFVALAAPDGKGDRSAPLLSNDVGI